MTDQNLEEPDQALMNYFKKYLMNLLGSYQNCSQPDKNVIKTNDKFLVE